ncbi:efflux RND transporter permease subunit [Verrucomicrobiota bacterium]
MLLSNYSIKFRIAVFVSIVVFVVVGAYNYMSMPREGAPDITIPYVFVTAVYEGTAPSEMEKLVTVPLEKSLNDVENVKEIRSTSAEGICSISIEFVAGQDIDLARQGVKDKVDLAKTDLPDDLDEPIVDAFNISSDIPVFTFALSGTDTGRLKNLAEDLQDEIELLSGVKDAEISGTREREIRVELDLRRLIAYNIPLSQVMQRIMQENKTISAGNIEMTGDKFQVRIPGEFEFVSQLNNVLLADRDDKPVYLTDIAQITDTYKDLSSIARLNGKSSVSISVKKRTGVNAVKLIDGVKKLIDDFRWPPDVTTNIVMDESEYVGMMISDLENNVASGFILVILVLFIFMGGRNSVFVALAIPLSMLVSFVGMGMAGFTLNMLVLFSLVIAVGMLVDNAIVIIENIYRNRLLGLSKIEAAKRGASEVAWPVITSTVTTCAVFSPLLFWPGIMGQFMGLLPKTLIIVLFASLFVAIIINPAVCSVLISSAGRGSGKPGEKKTHWFINGYEKILRNALKYRGYIIVIGVLFMIFTGLVYARFGKDKELFAEVEPRNATVSVKFPQGTSIERTDKTLKAIEDKLYKYNDIEFILTTVGSGSGMGGIWGGGSGTHQGNIHVEFLDQDERKTNTVELVGEIRTAIGKIPGAEVAVKKEEMGPPTGEAITIELSGEDFDVLSVYAQKIINEIKSVPGLVNLQDDFEEALPELQFKVDRHRAALLGLDTDTIGLFLRTSIYGIESSKFRPDEDEYDITLRLPENQRSTLALLDEIFIPLQGGGSVPLSSVGEVVYEAGKGSINRKDQKRMVSITGDNQDRSVDAILKDIRKRLKKIEFPRGYSVNYAGDTEEMQEAMAFLFRAFLVALFMIFLILVLQFNSVVLPFIILFTVILSFTGVQWSLLICNMKPSVVMTGLGIISLAGIVVNNAIVLIDCILQRRKEGMNATEAVVAAGRMRLRPVLLTAVTTILGLIPMAIGYSLDIHSWPPKIVAGGETSSWWVPMAVAVIFGLALATVLTLVLVPVMYSLADSISSSTRKLLGPKDE